MKIPIIVSLTFLFSVGIANAHLGLEDGWVEHVPVEFEYENKQYEMTFATYHDSISGFEFNENTIPLQKSIQSQNCFENRQREDHVKTAIKLSGYRRLK